MGARVVILGSMAFLACGSPVSAPVSDDAPGSDDALATQGTLPGTSTTSGSVSTSTGDPEDGVPFIEPTDLPFPYECELWTGDGCDMGEKCMPWFDERGSWKGSACKPVAPDPVSPGERCSVHRSPLSGIDDCQPHSMCWHVDRVTLEGICVALCRGSQSEPSCDGPCDYCAAATGMPLCLSQCNPVLQDCLPGYGCYPVDDTFSCLKHAGGPADTCAYINACSPGWFCAPARSVNGCESRTGCCAPFCDLTAREPCASSDARTECIPSYDDDVAPEDGCLDHGRIGGCLLSD